MSFYTCFEWFKNLRLFVNVRNIKNKRRSQGVIRNNLNQVVHTLA